MLNIGEGQYRQRHLEEALKLLTEVEQLCVDLGDRLLLAEARRGLGKAYFLNGNISTALQFLERALELFEQVRSRVHVAVARRSLAEVLSVHGPESPEGQRAEGLFRQSLEAFRDVGNEVEFARTARAFAEVLQAAAEARGEPGSSEAVELIAQAEEVSQKLKTSAEEPVRLSFAGRVGGTNPGITRIDHPAAMTEASVIVSPDALGPEDDDTPPEGIRIPTHDEP
jgi:tetratricopeptide (TPR) repeat protein